MELCPTNAICWPAVALAALIKIVLSLFQAALEAQKRRETDKSRITPSANGDLPRPTAGPRMTKGGGWLPSSTTMQPDDQPDDPLLQQINIIRSFLKQAQAANRKDEVAMLEENLKQLEEEYDTQQMSQALEFSRRQAEEENLQRSQILHLQQKEIEGKRFSRTCSSEELDEKEQAGSPQQRILSIDSFPRLPGNSPPSLRDERTTTPSEGEVRAEASFNPFDDGDATPGEEDPTNPFCEEIKKENLQRVNGKVSDYNPFDDETETDLEKQSTSGNPFGDDSNEKDEKNPFKEISGVLLATSTNPFDEEDGPALDDVIEEELLLQQIDNIRAYIFDAKLSGRIDEVELLSQNLRELQSTLQEQKRKAH